MVESTLRQQAAQRAMSAKEPKLGGVRRDTEPRGDLCDAGAFEVPQDHHGPIGSRQRAERAANERSELAAQERPFRSRAKFASPRRDLA